MQTNKIVTKTVWNTKEQINVYEALKTDIVVDVVVIGAGITGITTAYLLANAGLKVAVLEAYKVGWGTTGSSTGNLYIPVGNRMSTLQSKHGVDILKEVVTSRKIAIDFIEEQVHHHQINCAFRRIPWHLFTTDENKNKEIEGEFEIARSLQLQTDNILPHSFPIENVTAITTIHHQAQLNALTYVQGLAKAIPTNQCAIYEDSPVTMIEENRESCVAVTERGKVYAKKVVMATHSPKGIYAVHSAMEAHREYVVTAKLNAALPRGGIYWHALGTQQYSIRPYSNATGDYLLVLGEPHLVGDKVNNEENLDKICHYLSQHFDVDRIFFRWAAQNYKPADSLPYIGVSPLQRHTYIATGFAADGLVYGTVAAMIIRDHLLEKENSWSKIYDPKRFTPLASAGQFLKENIAVATHLLKDYLFYGDVDEIKNIHLGEGKTLKLDGEKVAIHRDEKNQLHIVSAICTHMGCVVHWNNAEKSWDCPCHGSRFSVDGAVLEGPAWKPLAIPKSRSQD